MALPRVSLIATGGTIACQYNTATNSVTTCLTVEDLVANIPELNRIANVSLQQFSNMSSWEMTVQDMFELWKTISCEFKKGIKAVVVTHGTDTLEETAFFLSLCHQGPETLVITGAMRDSSELASDGSRNIFQSVKVSVDAQSINRNVLVVFNDEIYAGADIRKRHSWLSNPFFSSGGPIGSVLREVRYWNTYPTKRQITPQHVNAQVPILKTWTGDSGRYLDAWLKIGMDGLVIEGTGLGNVHPSLLPILQKLKELNIPIVITTQAFEGGTLPIYGGRGGGKSLSDQGFILANQLSASKARLQLIMLLGAGIVREDIPYYFI